MATKILRASDKIIKDAHDAFETIDGGELIEFPGDGGMAAGDFADIKGKGVFHLGNDRRGGARHVEIGLTSHEGDGFEIRAIPIVRPLLLGDGIRVPSDNKIQRIRPNIATTLGRVVQQTLGVRRGGRKVVIANDELVIAIGSTELHAALGLPSTDDRDAARLWPWGKSTVGHGEELAAEVRASGRPQLPQDGDVFSGVVIST